MKKTVALALGSGAARGYTHIGVIDALEARGYDIVMVSGCSMGAVVGGFYCAGQLDVYRNWVCGLKYLDVLKLVDLSLLSGGVIRGDRVFNIISEMLNGRNIEDLPIPLTAVATDLTNKKEIWFQRGSLQDAVRASAAIPSLLTPVANNGRMLVDGAVLNNFPADVMSALHLGPVVGVDVTRGRSITARDVARPSSVFRWILSGAWRQGPPIVSLLMRAATVPTGRDLRAARESVDLLVTPDMTGVEIRNWEAYDPAVNAGYHAMGAALDRLTTPVTELRRRKALSEGGGKGWR